MMLSRSTLLLVSLSLGGSGCITTYFTPPYDHPMFAVMDNCNGCDVGDSAVHPAVIEYVLSRPESKIAEHYKHLMGVETGAMKQAPADAYNTYIRQRMMLDLAWLVAGAGDFLAAEAAKKGGSGTEIATMAPGLTDGEALARAVAKLTSPHLAPAFAEAKRAQWNWANRWEKNDEGLWDQPSMMGLTTSILVGKAADKTVALYHFGKDLDVSEPALLYDLTDVPGAFDPAAALTFEDVAAKIKPKAK